MTAMHWLALTAVVTALLPLVYTNGRIAAIGLGGAMGNPSAELAAKEPDWSRRGKAAHYNAIENLAPFAALILAAQALGLGANATIILAAELFFAARLLHFVVYTAGIPVLRTLAFAVGLIADLMIAKVIFFG